MFKVFIDGQEGTTGLQLARRLEGRKDIELMPIADALRKDEGERARLMNAADLVFLCLPDEAARSAVGLITNGATRVVDASTAHRVAPGWIYGFAELSPARRAAIRAGKRIANPGCYATGFLAAAYPLVALGLIDPSAQLVCHAVSGYSGAGKRGIAQYQAADRGQVWPARACTRWAWPTSTCRRCKMSPGWKIRPYSARRSAISTRACRFRCRCGRACLQNPSR